LITAGEATTFDGLIKELDILERLDAAMSRCFKQLLLVRGIKSISESHLPTSRPKQITGPSKAATAINISQTTSSQVESLL
jgi:hypothetical protein